MGTFLCERCQKRWPDVAYYHCPECYPRWALFDFILLFGGFVVFLIGFWGGWVVIVAWAAGWLQ